MGSLAKSIGFRLPLTAQAYDTGAAGVAAGNAASSAAGVFNAQNASVQPTLIIRPGYQFNVLVAKDIVLKPWRTQ